MKVSSSVGKKMKELQARGYNMRSSHELATSSASGMDDNDDDDKAAPNKTAKKTKTLTKKGGGKDVANKPGGIKI